MPSRIEDYAMIGDCETAALVGKDGSIDWLCLPRFDSAACFAALLGTQENGRWLIAPQATIQRVRRQYRDSTLILETTFETDEGIATLIDCMPVREDAPSLVRCVRGDRGKVTMHTELTIRFDYGSIVPWVRKREGGIHAIGGPDSLIIRTPVPLEGKNLATTGEFTVAEGETIPFVLTWFPSHHSVPVALQFQEHLDRTEKYWRQWSARCQYHGRWRQQVLRSLLILKGLTFEPTGGIVAAPTTSLPEQWRGARNWDYRYCWLRDATFTLYSLLEAGYHHEARAWRRWLLRAVAGTPSDLQIMYGIAGERRLPEWEVSWLPGYENARPVRVGNAASEQLQLDVAGEMLDVLYQARLAGLDGIDEDWHLEQAVLEFLGENWHQPDEGIWEVRGQRQHFTHSKVMAWVAFDRAVKSVERLGLQGPVNHWRAIRHQIHQEVCERGFNKKLNSFVRYYEAEELDAALLLIPLVGFLPPKDPRVVSTVEAIRTQLDRGGFIARYDTTTGVDGLSGGEGVFLPCTFWLADNLAMQGRREEAEELFDHLLGLCNDVGLISEEYDPASGRLMGNFPQAFTHVALVNTAYCLSSKQSPAQRRLEN